MPLAPLDPRSLMQGDYMALRFELANDVMDEPAGGVVVVKLDARRVATFVRREDGSPLGPDERRLRYTSRAGRPVFGADAFLFEEGRAKAFEAAKFGGMRVDPRGQLILESLHDEALRRIECSRWRGMQPWDSRSCAARMVDPTVVERRLCGCGGAMVAHPKRLGG